MTKSRKIKLIKELVLSIWMDKDTNKGWAKLEMFLDQILEDDHK